MARHLFAPRCTLAAFRPPHPMRYSLAFLLALALPLCAIAAGQTASLPAGAKIDPQRVIAERYGQASANAAAVPTQTAHKLAIPAGGITHVIVEADATQDRVPITFGQVFAPGDLRQGE